MKKRITYILLPVVVVVAGLSVFLAFGRTAQTVELETALVIRGGISDVITATGTLEAVETVEVGTQVSGVIEKIYVDYNSQVKKGQLLAKLDETPLVAQLDQSKASVDQAEAELQYQKATYERYQVLIEKKLIAQSDYDLVVYNYNKAVASLNNARSVYDKNKINLSYASIYSPIDGIILDRAVDEGQTVAASFNTPTLFTIANDLTQMQVEANVDEADIGNVRIGQRVEFTVDAYPNLKFEGDVIQIRLLPVESSNVITYTVVINAPNPYKKLMPGMTANASFYVKEKENIVLMPAKALNFNPDKQLLDAYLESHPEIKLQLSDSEMTGSENPGKAVWVKRGDVISWQLVGLGETDEAYYEVVSGLKEGDEVLVSLNAGPAGAGEKSTARSPFMPQRPGSNRKN
ncbi:efflux RND transporter periplasmic adaptor subunit [Gaoshiqia sp. Z1-71]|uniref:efflux RND transporter periplasmic adaptor subunit n=1 Tax=Gaoshiqia hydrogeniformans TaxID=3290090 RepID=UPI003BF900D0